MSGAGRDRAEGASDDRDSPTRQPAAASARRRTATRPRWPREIEARWQDRWEAEGTFEAPNPAGPLAEPDKVAGRPKQYVLDMFPYPSGIGLHVGHPLGYIATDVYGRFKRMTGHNVLHALGYDAFGLPAEQYAVQTGQHPRITTEANIATMRAPAAPAGPGPRPAPQRRHDRPRVLPLDAVDLPADLQRLVRRRRPQRARPIAELEAVLAAGDAAGAARRAGVPAGRCLGRPGRAGPPPGRRRAPAGLPVRRAGQLVPRPGHRAGQRGGHRRRPQRARQLPGLQAQPAPVDDAHHRLRRPAADRPGPAGLAGADQAACSATGSAAPRARGSRFPSRGRRRSRCSPPGRTRCSARPSWCWRPSTRWSTRWPPAPGPADVPTAWTGGAATPRDAVEALPPGRRADDRPGAADRGPREDRRLHRRVRDQPGHRRADPGVRRRLRADGLRHRRDHGGARPGRARLGVRRALRPADRPHRRSRRRAGRARRTPARAPAINSANDEISLDGLEVAEAKARIIDWLESKGTGRRTVTYKLRDWLFSRQRYWGEPFPIVYDEHDLPVALPESMLPVELPEVDDYSPRTFAEDDDHPSRSRRWPASATGSR